MGREFFFSVFLVLSSTGDRGGEREEEEEEEDEDEEDDEEDDDAARREERDLGVAAADLVAAALDFAGVVDDFDFPRSASKRKEIDGFKKCTECRHEYYCTSVYRSTPLQFGIVPTCRDGGDGHDNHELYPLRRHSHSLPSFFRGIVCLRYSLFFSAARDQISDQETKKKKETCFPSSNQESENRSLFPPLKSRLATTDMHFLSPPPSSSSSSGRRWKSKQDFLTVVWQKRRRGGFFPRHLIAQTGQARSSACSCLMAFDSRNRFLPLFRSALTDRFLQVAAAATQNEFPLRSANICERDPR